MERKYSDYCGSSCISNAQFDQSCDDCDVGGYVGIVKTYIDTFGLDAFRDLVSRCRSSLRPKEVPGNE